jgi:hypothetical protein
MQICVFLKEIAMKNTYHLEDSVKFDKTSAQ